MKGVKITPVKANHTKVIMKLIRENAALRKRLSKKHEKLFGGNPTEYFRKIREKTR